MSESKPFKPTRKKLRKLEQEGTLLRSQYLTKFTSYFLVFAYLYTWGNSFCFGHKEYRRNASASEKMSKLNDLRALCRKFRSYRLRRGGGIQHRNSLQKREDRRATRKLRRGNPCFIGSDVEEAEPIRARQSDLPIW